MERQSDKPNKVNQPSQLDPDAAPVEQDPLVEQNPPAKDVQWLVDIMARLLSPAGCPWDREQTLDTLKPFLLEEAYEVLDAIEEGDPAHHCEELGDLFFQIIFQAALAHLTMEQIITGIGEKLIRRHPHVFGDTVVEDSREVKVNWDRIKQTERGARRGTLEGVPRSMPSLQRAHRLSRKAARVGFDWPDLPSVREKVTEELEELDQAIALGIPQEIQHEVGDLLFAVANWARKLGLDPEITLQQANQRFIRRFGFVEQQIEQQGKTLEQSSLEEMDALWDEAKRREL